MREGQPAKRKAYRKASSVSFLFGVWKKGSNKLTVDFSLRFLLTASVAPLYLNAEKKKKAKED